MTPVLQTAVGLAIPFVGTALGAAAVFLFKSNIPPRVQKILLGFASGVMLAASVWSLLLPALELSGSWLPVVVGFLVGIGFLLGLDQLTARLHLEPKPGTAGANSFLLVLAVTLHNVPEGMAVGVALPVCWQVTGPLRRRTPLPLLSESHCKIFRRAPLWRRRCAATVALAAVPLCMGYCPVP